MRRKLRGKLRLKPTEEDNLYKNSIKGKKDVEMALHSFDSPISGWWSNKWEPIKTIEKKDRKKP